MTAYLGYADPAYVASLADVGEARRLPASGGWLLVRRGPHRVTDATGPYPVFACLNWNGLGSDLTSLAGELASVVLVSDPFADAAHDALASLKPAVLRPYRDHFVVDLSRPSDEIGRPSRRSTARKAADTVDMAIVGGEDADPEEWVALYQNVIDRHEVSGVAAFSPAALSAQLRVPGCSYLTARHAGELVAAQVCLRQGDVVVSHLAASSSLGYRLRAMHALDLFALEYFADSAAWFDFGGGGGKVGDTMDGLSQYKASWATDVRPTWLAGVITDEATYAAAVAAGGHGRSDFFPAYRAPETASGRPT